MKPGATITFALPKDVGREVEKIAKEEHRTVSELVTEALRQYRALRSFHRLAAEARKAVKAKGLTEKDFGGPFAK